MKVSEAAKLWLEYHKCHSKENSIRAYRLVLTKILQGIRGRESGGDNHGKDSLLPKSNHRRQKAANQKNTLLPFIGFFQFHQKLHRSGFPESLRHPHVEKAFQGQTFLSIGTSSKKKQWMKLFSEHQNQGIG